MFTGHEIALASTSAANEKEITESLKLMIASKVEEIVGLAMGNIFMQDQGIALRAICSVTANGTLSHNIEIINSHDLINVTVDMLHSDGEALLKGVEVSVGYKDADEDPKALVYADTKLSQALEITRNYRAKLGNEAVERNSRLRKMQEIIRIQGQHIPRKQVLALPSLS